MLVHFMGALIKSNQVQHTEFANKLLESQEYRVSPFRLDSKLA